PVGQITCVPAGKSVEWRRRNRAPLATDQAASMRSRAAEVPETPAARLSPPNMARRSSAKRSASSEHEGAPRAGFTGGEAQEQPRRAASAKTDILGLRLAKLGSGGSVVRLVPVRAS